MKKLIFAFGAAVVVVACNPKVAEVSDSDAPAMTAAAKEGKEIFAKSCTKCHGAKKIDNYSREEWDGILPNMIAKAELSDEAAANVTEYVYWELEH